MDVKLCLVKGNPKGKEVPVNAGTLKVGRAEDSDLIIASTRVSRHHCAIIHEGERVIIRDIGSTNGCFVNGDRVKEQDLKAGDRVEIGSLTFVVEIDGVREAAPAEALAPGAPQVPSDDVEFPEPAAGRPSTNDILAGLERLSESKPDDTTLGPPEEHEDDDVLRLSDEDLLDAE